MTEAELAEKVTKMYEKDGYDIYSEVMYKPGSKRADIIATKDNEYIGIEVKKGMNLKLIEQAYYWKDKTHKTYIFLISKIKMNDFGIKLCRDMGIGIYIYRNNTVQMILDSTYCENPELPQLYEQQKDSQAGSKGGGYVTPFSLTKQCLIEYMRKKKDDTLRNAIKEIKHHYSNDNSAMGALKKLISINVIPELKVYKKGRTVYIKIK